MNDSVEEELAFGKYEAAQLKMKQSFCLPHLPGAKKVEGELEGEKFVPPNKYQKYIAESTFEHKRS